MREGGGRLGRGESGGGEERGQRKALMLPLFWSVDRRLAIWLNDSRIPSIILFSSRDL